MTGLLVSLIISKIIKSTEVKLATEICITCLNISTLGFLNIEMFSIGEGTS